MRKYLLVAVACALVLAAVGSAAAARDKVQWVGEGIRLVLRGGEYTIFSGEPCWVRHGWGSLEEYPGYNSQYLHESGWVTQGGAYVAVYLDGERLHLDHEVIHRVLDEPGHSVTNWDWYIQFPAGYFAPGIYVLTLEYGCRSPRNALASIGLPHFYDTLLYVEP